MPIETFSFDKGMNRKKGKLYLSDGENYTMTGVVFPEDGQVETRPSMEAGELIDSTSTSIINGIHRFDDSIYASSKTWCPGNQVQFNYIYHRYANLVSQDLLINGNWANGDIRGWTNWSNTGARCDVVSNILELGDATTSNLVTNGTFDSNITGWTDFSSGTGTIHWSAGTLEIHAGTGVGCAEQIITTIVGYTYTFSFTSSQYSIDLKLGSSHLGGEYVNQTYQPGSHSTTFVATSTSTYINFLSIINHPHIDNVTCYTSGGKGWVEQSISTLSGSVYNVIVNNSGLSLDVVAVGTTSKGTDLLNETSVGEGINQYSFTATGSVAYIHTYSTKPSPYSLIHSIACTSSAGSMSYSNVTKAYGNQRPKFTDYEGFTFLVDGKGKKAFYQNKLYEWGVDKPLAAPTVSDSGSGGNPNGTYSCYCTFYVIFPNDKSVETDLSPAASVTVATNKISWTNIPVCPYGGSGLEIHRKLYREILGVQYLVTEISNNNAGETYTDDLTDANLQTNPAFACADYAAPPDGMIDLTVYLQRVFGIKDNKLYWSEAYKPFSWLTTSDISVSREGETLTGVVTWGDNVYLPSVLDWYRLSGTDPTTWTIKRTFADNGVVNRHTIKRTKYGILGLWYDGIYRFDGSTNINVTMKLLGKDFFTSIQDYSVAYSEYDGNQYRLYYASTGSTIDKCLVLDMTYHPEDRVYFSNFLADAEEIYKDENIQYLAKSGYEYSEGTTETIPIEIVTREVGFGVILKRKVGDYLYYDIDTGGKNVSVSVFVDGTVSQVLTLNTTTRQRKRSQKLNMSEGYRFSLTISSSDASGVSIYAPWTLEATPVGD